MSTLEHTGKEIALFTHYLLEYNFTTSDITVDNGTVYKDAKLTITGKYYRVREYYEFEPYKLTITEELGGGGAGGSSTLNKYVADISSKDTNNDGMADYNIISRVTGGVGTYDSFLDNPYEPPTVVGQGGIGGSSIGGFGGNGSVNITAEGRIDLFDEYKNYLFTYGNEPLDLNYTLEEWLARQDGASGGVIIYYS